MNSATAHKLQVTRMSQNPHYKSVSLSRWQCHETSVGVALHCWKLHAIVQQLWYTVWSWICCQRDVLQPDVRGDILSFSFLSVWFDSTCFNMIQHASTSDYTDRQSSHRWMGPVCDRSAGGTAQDTWVRSLKLQNAILDAVVWGCQ